MVPLAGKPAEVVRRELRVTGTVQGVGFRPFVYRLATAMDLRGWVLNSEQGVTVDVEGAPAAVRAFAHALRHEAPPLAVVGEVAERVLDPVGYNSFAIIESRAGEARVTSVPPDAAVCDDCRRELQDPRNRRHGYPFTNCTNCGPRFTIVTEIPYDRPKTTMAGFAMCPTCSQEYHDPLDRRFHAQPNACPDCGPQARLVDQWGRELGGVEVAGQLLRWGLTVAVKGLGGFHLACDAASGSAVAQLRRRKGRPHRPLAVMARDMETVRLLCKVSAEEERLLRSPSAPIVLLELLPGAPVAPEVAPGLRHLGVMLPYTPLHLLLFEHGPAVQVMTSGNPSGLPICIDEAEALSKLGHLADAFLIHNRPIHIPCDDSVVQVADGEPFFLRRSRGYVPTPVDVAGGEPALGTGGDMKNAFCLVAGRRAVFSQHLGDLETEEAQAGFRRALEHLVHLTGIAPRVVGYDLHPGYHSSALARQLPAEAHVAVQHHHAHMAACMAEHGLTGNAVGLVLDGTGYGPDGAIWGFEVLAGGFESVRRIAHLAYSPLLGGEAAIRHPLLAATGLVGAHLGTVESLGDGEEVMRATALMKAKINCPAVGSAGRLFDAVSALLGICRRQTYEGQAAVELGAVAVAGPPFPIRLTGDQFEVAPFLEPLLAYADRPAEGAGRFLATVVEILVAGARRAREETGWSTVCLSGGTFQSAWLLERTTARLTEAGFRVYRHRAVPPGDGGIGLGQAMVALRRWQQGCV